MHDLTIRRVKRGPVPKKAPVDPADLCCDAPALEMFRDEDAGHVSVRCRACGWQIGQPKVGEEVHG